MQTTVPIDIAIYRPRLAAYFADQPMVQAAYVFGSYGRGQAGPLSDVDIAVWLVNDIPEENYLDERLRLMGDLSEILNFDAVDVVILNQAPLALAYRVIRDGALLYCRNRDALTLFVAQTIMMYLDFEPILIRHQRAILDRARRGELTRGYNPYHGALEHYRQLRQRLKEREGSDD